MITNRRQVSFRMVCMKDILRLFYSWDDVSITSLFFTSNWNIRKNINFKRMVGCDEGAYIYDVRTEGGGGESSYLLKLNNRSIVFLAIFCRRHKCMAPYWSASNTLSNDIQMIRMSKHLNFISPWGNWAKKNIFPQTDFVELLVCF